jgi:hypothetical protein
MLIFRATAMTVALVSVATPVFASTQIAVLGRAPLVGRIASTTQLRHDVGQYDARFAAVASAMGLTPAEYRDFRREIAVGHPAYVTIPRHLDYTSSYYNGAAHVMRDVVIPADQHGWEIDIVAKHRTLALFIPNVCGNLSLIVRPERRLAAAPLPTAVLPARVARAPIAPPAVVAPAPVAASPVPPAQIAEAPVPAPPADLPPPVVHHVSFLGPLLGAIGAVLIGTAIGGGGGGSNSGGTVTGINCP